MVDLKDNFVTTIPEALTLRFLRNFRKLTAKNTTKLGN